MALAQPLGEHASLAECVLIEKERATLIVWGHSFEVGLLLFKSLSSARQSPSASDVAAASQWEQKHLAGESLASWQQQTETT